MASAHLVRESNGHWLLVPVHQRLQRRAAELCDQAEELYASARQLRGNYLERELAMVTWIHDRHEVMATYSGMQERATTSIWALDKGPHPVESQVQSMPQGERLRHGVSYRVVYGAEVLQVPQLLRVMRESVAQGEQARTMPRVPLNLIIADEGEGLILLPEGHAPTESLHLRPSRILSMFVEVFEICWEIAAPIAAIRSAGGPDVDSVHLLALMSAGLTDESIARELGVSERTVSRRIARMQEQLAARSRFQLGVQAVRRGWLEPVS